MGDRRVSPTPIENIRLAFVQVENLNTFQGHSGPIRGLACREEVPEFLSVSEDYSLRCWTWKTGTPCICTPTCIFTVMTNNSFHVYSHSQCVVSVFSECTHAHKGQVSAVCFSPLGDVLLAGYESGLLEIWQYNSIVGHKQVKTHHCKINAVHLFICQVINRCVCVADF